MDLVWLFSPAASLDKGSVSIRRDQLPYERKWKKNPGIVFPNPLTVSQSCLSRIPPACSAAVVGWPVFSTTRASSDGASLLQPPTELAALNGMRHIFPFLLEPQTPYSHGPCTASPDKCDRTGGCWGQTHWHEFDRQLKMSPGCRNWSQESYMVIQNTFSADTLF